ncbi:hypothetical protein PVAP13_6NG060300 [Panicum virgatum]|uniref:Uncharacterized protein n=1 Tax=Panicum virgatum TaxID=38727 RepID=A0A8T0QUK6_PANVG|nr:hypothetical protein PVAP13_6NG060300 [Panicum virgatum]
MAALLGNADARALLLAAIVAMAMVLSPDPAQAQAINCIDLRNGPNGKCDQATCTRACKAASYVDPVATCKSAHICCCLVKCCGESAA